MYPVRTGTVRRVARTRERRTQQERSEATVRVLLDAARKLFAADGYAATSLDAIAAAAGVTKGALYHHFTGKPDVFQAVFEDLLRELCDEIAAAASAKRDPWARVEAGCMAWLDVCLEPGVRQFVLLDAPVALGWEKTRELEYRHNLGLWRRGLEDAMEAGSLRRRPVDPLAYLLFGAICEGVMAGARAADQEATMEQVRREYRRLLRAVKDS